MRFILQQRDITIPTTVTLTLKARTVSVTGPRGSLTKTFDHVNIELTLVKKASADQTGKLTAKVHHGKRKHVACIRTICSHIENMIKGVTIGFEYKMRFVYAHFPINANIRFGNNNTANRATTLRFATFSATK